MKKAIILLSAVAVVTTSCHTSSPASLAKTESDSLSYAIGYDVGSSIKYNVDSVLIKPEVVAAAIRDVFNNKTAMTQEEAYEFLQEYFMVRKPAKDKENADQLISEAVKNIKNVQKTESGLYYEIIDAGSSDKATDSRDTVVVEYVGKFISNGEQFDSSEDHGGSSTFALNNVIPGWTEGIQLVGKGGKINLWIPYELAYGERGRGPIGPMQPLYFEVEVIDVKPFKE
ncbi:MAG: FKBP-type peptidyl-prolyl cis-trans isomerase [Rikenellaceae bacterium]|nr:FKBP-type peptidyl-prolyl cis-trans isomerase [Rikenellaceae bacterium]